MYLSRVHDQNIVLEAKIVQLCCGARVHMPDTIHNVLVAVPDQHNNVIGL